MGGSSLWGLRGKLLLITLFMWSPGIVRGISAGCRFLLLLLGIYPPQVFILLRQFLENTLFGGHCLYTPFIPQLWCPLKRHENPHLASRLDLKEPPFLATVPAEEKFPSFPLQSKECSLVIAKAFPCQFSSHLRYSQLVFPLSSPQAMFPP